jgi:hypothetical protein
MLDTVWLGRFVCSLGAAPSNRKACLASCPPTQPRCACKSRRGVGCPNGSRATDSPRCRSVRRRKVPRERTADTCCQSGPPCLPVHRRSGYSLAALLLDTALNGYLGSNVSCILAGCLHSVAKFVFHAETFDPMFLCIAEALCRLADIRA